MLLRCGGLAPGQSVLILAEPASGGYYDPVLAEEVARVAGALGLMAGHRFPTLGAAAAGWLALLMVCGLLARLRIRDPFTAMLPATVLMLLNGLLALAWFL